jgi:hypothetical protein
VSTRRGALKTKRADSIEPSARLVSGARLESRVTGLAIEQALAELGIHAKLRDIVAKAQSIENGIMQSRSRRKPEQMC